MNLNGTPHERHFHRAVPGLNRLPPRVQTFSSCEHSNSNRLTQFWLPTIQEILRSVILLMVTLLLTAMLYSTLASVEYMNQMSQSLDRLAKQAEQRNAGQ